MRHGRRTAATIMVLATLVASQAQAASVCPIGSGLTARQVRLLQTELMVAALTCRSNAALDLDGKYGSFARKFGPELKQHGDALRAEFKGNHSRLDKYVTGVANASSDVSVSDVRYCDKVVGLFDSVLAVKPGALDDFAAAKAGEFAAAHAAGVAGCTGQKTRTAKKAQ